MIVQIPASNSNFIHPGSGLTKGDLDCACR